MLVKLVGTLDWHLVYHTVTPSHMYAPRDVNLNVPEDEGVAVVTRNNFLLIIINIWTFLINVSL